MSFLIKIVIKYVHVQYLINNDGEIGLSQGG